MNQADALAQLLEEKTELLLLQFTDIMGSIKTVEIPADRFEVALAGEVSFDGSALEGFHRTIESELLLKPDLETLRLSPAVEGETRTARLICDVHDLDHTPFEGCPRTRLKNVLELFAQRGFSVLVAPEIEFFLFQRDEKLNPTTRTSDPGSYFDLVPMDRGEETRRRIVTELRAAGFTIEAGHHEIAHGQHEIDLKETPALQSADIIATLRMITRAVAASRGFHATFMPKPVFGQDGSGMHVHILVFKNGKNAFENPKGQYGVSKVAGHFIAGLLRHARGFTAVTNPLINSYKRLVPGFESPTHSVWSEQNVNPLVRVPPTRGPQTRCELRNPDPSCNPYLALAVILRAGLEGIIEELEPSPPISKNIYRMSARERGRFSIDPLPTDLSEATAALRKDKVAQEALGPVIFRYLVEAQQAHWREYSMQVHPWELDHYLAYY
ncbi:MAG: type I glutamate--ammonia ligase [Acidobacteria bacterium RIFCSPLOWO2_12_FULL_54_10]|nr:MAG: type I glutamate--ammonia ligase [Acidobacteria bacterium RIFCSPLOWO2_12_FULL_54_10]